MLDDTLLEFGFRIHHRIHHDNPGAHCHGFHLVVGDINHRRLEPLVQLDDLAAHLDAHLGIEVRERFIEEENLGLPHDRASHSDALALAAGEGFWLSQKKLLEAENRRRLVDPLLDLRLGEFPELEPERHVLVNAHVRVERIVLKDHGDVAILRRHVVDALVADENLAAGNLFEASDHAECGGFPASRGADEHDEFAVGDFYVEVPDGGDVFAFVAGVDLVYVAQGNLSHSTLYILVKLLCPQI